MIIGVEEAAGMRHDDIAAWRQGDAARCLLEDRTANKSLQAFDLGADGRLAEPQLLAGLGEASGFRDDDQSADDLGGDIRVLMAVLHLLEVTFLKSPNPDGN